VDLKQNPFSLYDFLGFLIPGALFYYLLFGIAYVNFPGNILVEEIGKILPKAEIYIPFVFISYLTGVILSYISSSTLYGRPDILQRICMKIILNIISLLGNHVY
jgi:hypothetical protein